MAGFRGVILQIEWQYNDGSPGESRAPDAIARMARAFGDVGLDVGWWGWVAPRGAAAWQRRLDQLDAAGVPAPSILVLDAEPDSGWGEDAAGRAASFGEVQHPAPLGVTSYGYLPSAVRGFDFCEVGLPQCYDPDGGPRRRPGFVSRCCSTWERGLPGVSIMPALGSNATAPDRMAELAREAAECRVAGAAWFALTGLRGARLRAAAAVEFNVEVSRG